MRISPSPVFAFVEHSPWLRVGTGVPKLERSRMCEVPLGTRTSSHCRLADAIATNQIVHNGNAAKLLRSDGGASRNRERRRQITCPKRVRVLVFLQRVCRSHGQSFTICAPSFRIRVALFEPASCVPRRHPD